MTILGPNNAELLISHRGGKSIAKTAIKCDKSNQVKILVEGQQWKFQQLNNFLFRIGASFASGQRKKFVNGLKMQINAPKHKRLYMITKKVDELFSKAANFWFSEIMR